MSEYKRFFRAGGTWFFTVNLADRNGDLLTTEIALFRQVVASVRATRPFRIEAWCVMPDHMHCIWTLPEGDSDFPSRWRLIKKCFSMALPKWETRTVVNIARGERGIWQRRYWEHLIRDEHDLQAHVNYTYFNPMKHGWVKRVVDWPYSSFHRDVRAGLFEPNWCGGDDISSFRDD